MQKTPVLSINIMASKSFTTAQSDEHTRRWSDKRWETGKGYGAYDRTREHLNFEIVKGKITPINKEKSIPERIKENIAARGIRDPNEGLANPKFRTVVNIIFQGSHDRMHEIAFGNQRIDLNKDADNSHIIRTKDIEQWALDTYNFAAKSGVKRILPHSLYTLTNRIRTVI